MKSWKRRRRKKYKYDEKIDEDDGIESWNEEEEKHLEK